MAKFRKILPKCRTQFKINKFVHINHPVLKSAILSNLD